ncbi:MAG: TetR family transcriptional regulator [Rhodospirillales bacterium]|nr:TetR family transcriptional regulator [Rhodospirillales bacterium]MDP6646517.1 TetR family transcriptional regulator [Rhodospirillales bacterium]MDP6840158.1 TetR family transcriptional regulator [Rhodospirillales bacterium]|tara:strand:+ start:1036 stop:1653 length:618 start_codon:yes stop_codon:yes gene_type:complete
MAKKPDTDWRIITTALKLGADEGWRRLTLARIAEAAKIPLADLNARFSSKWAILNGFSLRIDQQALKAAGDDGSSIRDRLFDLIMCRFDTLHPHKSQLRAIARDVVPADPISGLCGLCAMRRAMTKTLEAAGVSTTGLLGRIKIKALSLAYLDAFRVWLMDDSETQDRVMARLDKSLARLEHLADTFITPGRPGGDADAENASSA